MHGIVFYAMFYETWSIGKKVAYQDMYRRVKGESQTFLEHARTILGYKRTGQYLYKPSTNSLPKGVL
jgi:hypothetical protein